MRISLPVFSLFLLLSSCSVSKQLSKSATSMILTDSALVNAHVGISVYDPSAGKYLYDYNGDKYFVPASNTKIPTCYAVMKYLGDSLVGLRYGIPYDKKTKEPLKILAIQPAGDPTFLHEDFKNQPVFEFLKQKLVDEKFEAAVMDTIWKEEALGSGWSWNDYESDYMAERNIFPVFGNVIRIILRDSTEWLGEEYSPEQYRANYFITPSHYFDSLVNKNMFPGSRNKLFGPGRLNTTIHRDLASNNFRFKASSRRFAGTTITFSTEGMSTALNILSDTLRIKDWGVLDLPVNKQEYPYYYPGGDIGFLYISDWKTIYSQSTDTMLKLMMHRSDNFYAEQSLLMVSNQRLGIMNDSRIIDTLLKSILKDLPQPPRWVDGSGLSRYNLFSPRDFVTILYKMKDEFGMERLKTILPTGNEGTLGGLYIKDSGYIFAKTGTLSGVVALSGFVYTKKNRLLIFSMLVNNHRGSAVPVRKAYQKFIQEIREKY